MINPENENLTAKLEAILPLVRKPARYAGQEFNSINKPRQPGEISVALCFPDVYEVGMSHLGLKILYDILNRGSDLRAERCFAPWPDMEEQLRKSRIPLFSLESKTPISEFDIVGFSLQYELSYTNLLQMLELSGIPVFSRDRQSFPIIIAGGPCCFNPEPVADFIDVFFIGESEDLIMEFMDRYRAFKRGSGISEDDLRLRSLAQRREFLGSLAGIDGLYVPEFYDRVKQGKINKRIFTDFSECDFFTAPVIPFVEAVHERIVLEIMRGCPNQCLFCQAGFTSRPVRVRGVEKLVEQAKKTFYATGFEDISFCSLSSSNYPHLRELIEAMHFFCKEETIGISLPSLRIDKSFLGVISKISDLNKAGLTFAPEAGTERLRKIINKNIDIEKLREAVAEAYRGGWEKLKLYFMIGLPTETEADVSAILDIAKNFSELRKNISGKRGRISVSVANFIPKPHTPFQWLGMESVENLTAKQEYLRKQARAMNLDVDFHDIRMSFLEALLTRGPRDTGRIIKAAYEKGARFDAWNSLFKFNLWQEAILGTKIDAEEIVHAKKSFDRALPWEHISCAPEPEILKQYLAHCPEII